MLQGPFRWIVWLSIIALAGLVWGLWHSYSARPVATSMGPPPSGSIPLAVLGDSDSHSYQDGLSFRAWGKERGGPYHANTLQWTEALSRLRGRQLDLGDWGVHGMRGVLTRMRRWIGLPGRSPRKQDYRHNFAVSGDGCPDLMGGSSRQVQSLMELMDEEPGRWREGVVVIRIGVNTFGQTPHLEAMARGRKVRSTQRRIAACVQSIRQSVLALHERQPDLRIVLVGMFDNSNWAKNLDRWQSPGMLARIGANLDRYDDALRTLADSDPRIAFFDDRAWFAARWGARDASGRPAYRDLMVQGLRISNTMGDEHGNATIADGHAGTVWNGKWAQSLVSLMNARFKLGLTPITDGEISQLLDGPAPPIGGPPAGPAASAEAAASQHGGR